MVEKKKKKNSEKAEGTKTRLHGGKSTLLS